MGGHHGRSSLYWSLSRLLAFREVRRDKEMIDPERERKRDRRRPISPTPLFLAPAKVRQGVGGGGRRPMPSNRYSILLLLLVIGVSLRPPPPPPLACTAPACERVCRVPHPRTQANIDVSNWPNIARLLATVCLACAGCGQFILGRRAERQGARGCTWLFVAGTATQRPPFSPTASMSTAGLSPRYRPGGSGGFPAKHSAMPGISVFGDPLPCPWDPASPSPAPAPAPLGPAIGTPPRELRRLVFLPFPSPPLPCLA